MLWSGIDRHWEELIGIGHWSSESCILHEPWLGKLITQTSGETKRGSDDENSTQIGVNGYGNIFGA